VFHISLKLKETIRTPYTSILTFNVNNNNYATMPKSFPSQYLQQVDFKFFSLISSLWL
jgi:hypothetical protein